MQHLHVVLDRDDRIGQPVEPGQRQRAWLGAHDARQRASDAFHHLDGALRDRVQGEIETLQGIVDRRLPPDDAALLSVAAALIEVEDSLDAQLVKLILPDTASHAAADDEPTDEEFRQVQDAVLRECIVNMARINEAITQALGAPSEAQGLDQVPQLVRGITAGLLMLGKQRDSCSRHIV